MLLSGFYLMFELVTSDVFSDIMLEASKKQFEHDCNSKYGEGNWSEYGADWISFDLHNHPPIYYNDRGISYTCFKNGTMP